MTPLEIALCVVLSLGIPWGSWISVKVVRIDAGLNGSNGHGLAADVDNLQKGLRARDDFCISQHTDSV